MKTILHRVACVENKASHPMAVALVGYAHLHGVEPTGEDTEFEIIVGEGVSAIVDGHTVHIGNARMANRLGWEEGATLLSEPNKEHNNKPYLSFCLQTHFAIMQLSWGFSVDAQD